MFKNFFLIFSNADVLKLVYDSLYYIMFTNNFVY